MIFKNPPHWLQEIPVKNKDNDYNVIILLRFTHYFSPYHSHLSYEAL